MKTNTIKRQHYKSDCVIVETFYNHSNGRTEQVAVPERIRLEYYIDPGKGRIVVEKKDNSFYNCTMSDDGMALIVSLPLSKHHIGQGLLLCEKIEYVKDDRFSSGYKTIVTPIQTNIKLWDRASDDDSSLSYGEILLSTIFRGKDGQGVPNGGKAGQFLVKKSDESYDTEWVDAPTPSVEIEVDATMSETSTNPVQNNTIKSYVDNAIEEVEANQIEVEEVTSLPNSPMKGERLILEWSNEDAEVLQPVSYDSATGYFTVEQMPSWLYEDGQIVMCVQNYGESILWNNAAINNVPFSNNNSLPTQYIKRVSATEFKVLSQQSEASSQVVIIANPDCSLFFYTNASVVAKFALQDENEDAPDGVHKYRIVVSDSSLVFGKTFSGVNSSKSYVISNAYHRYLGYRFTNENRCFGVSGEFTFEVDYDNGKYRYLGYIISGINRTAATATSEYVQCSNNTERWSDIWGFNKTKADSMGKAYFLLSASALTKSCKVKIYEIYD